MSEVLEINHTSNSSKVWDCTQDENTVLTHCGRVTQICVFNMVKLGTSPSSL